MGRLKSRVISFTLVAVMMLMIIVESTASAFERATFDVDYDYFELLDDSIYDYGGDDAPEVDYGENEEDGESDVFENDEDFDITECYCAFEECICIPEECLCYVYLCVCDIDSEEEYELKCDCIYDECVCEYEACLCGLYYCVCEMLDAQILQTFSDVGTARSFSAGGSHMLMLKSDGTVWGWGSNEHGQLGGNRGTFSYTTFTYVAGLSGIISISAGGDHSLALSQDGTVWSWGRNNQGQLGDGTTINRSEPVQVRNLSGVVAISAGSLHSLALRYDGSVWAWGSNGSGRLGDGTTTRRAEPIRVPGLSGITAVEAGDLNSFALHTNGTVWSWGVDGQRLGRPATAVQARTPGQLPGLGGVVSISTGATHTLALDVSGNVWAWGINTNGRLGDGTTTARATPIRLATLSNIVMVSAGNNHSLALGADGVVRSWGAYAVGQLGSGATRDASRLPGPVVVPGMVNLIEAGNQHSIAELFDDRVFVWGSNASGNLSIAGITNSPAPVQISVPMCANASIGVALSPHHISIPGVGVEHAQATARLYSWYGEHQANKVIRFSLERAYPGISIDRYTGVVTVSSAAQAGIIMITARSANIVGTGTLILSGNFTAPEISSCAHNLIRFPNGDTWSWGSNTFGQLGSAVGVASAELVPVDGVANGIASISVGGEHSLALSQDGTVWSWGRNNQGQLGDGTTINRSEPVQVRHLDGIVAVSAGSLHSLALRYDGTVWSWGNNQNGRLGDGTTTRRTEPVQVLGLRDVIAIEAGLAHSLALRADGTVWSWGTDGSRLGRIATATESRTAGQVQSLGGIVSISAGATHNLALDSNGNVWAWGYNTNGRLGDSTLLQRAVPVRLASLSNIVMVSAGNNHSLALGADGVVWSWGAYAVGQLGSAVTREASRVPGVVEVPGIARVIVAGNQHSVAELIDGRVFVWGSNANSRLGVSGIASSAAPLQISMPTFEELTVELSINPGYINTPDIGVERAQVSARVYNQDGVHQALEVVTYSLERPHRGVSIGRYTGLVTVSKAAHPGEVTILGRTANAIGNAVLAIYGDSPSAVISSGAHNFIRLHSGEVWAWGSNSFGQLGDITVAQYSPNLMETLSDFVKLSVGDVHSLALSQDGTVWSWGRNLAGQLGDGTRTNRNEPIQVLGLYDIIAVSAGASHSLALRYDGTVWSWGRNVDGQLGDGTVTMRLQPVMVTGLSDVIAVEAGYRYSLALRSDGTVWSWGTISYQLGRTATLDRSRVPGQVTGLSGIVEISAGQNHNLALDSNGHVWSWG